MELKQSDIGFDPKMQKFTACIAVRLADGNTVMLKARLELYAAVMDELDKIVEAKIGEFAEKYGAEVTKFAHRR